MNMSEVKRDIKRRNNFQNVLHIMFFDIGDGDFRKWNMEKWWLSFLGKGVPPSFRKGNKCIFISLNKKLVDILDRYEADIKRE